MRNSQLKYSDRRWRWKRAAWLAAHPLCVFCLARGIVRAATIVDHIQPHRGSDELYWSDDNLQSLCKPCHDGAKQARDKGKLLRGCGADGRPLDPNHRWNDSKGGGH